MSKRLPELATPLTKVRKAIVGFADKLFQKLSRRQQFWTGFSILCLTTTLLIGNPFLRSDIDIYQEGDIARESIISPADITFVDDERTEQLRTAARDTVLPSFQVESNKAEQTAQKFASLLERQKRFGSSSANSNKSEADAGSITALGKVLSSRGHTQSELDAVRAALKESSEGYIYKETDRQYFSTSGVTLVDKARPGQTSAESLPESNWTTLDAARKKLRDRLSSIKTLSPAEVGTWYEALSELVQPSVFFDAEATQLARVSAANSIPPETITLKRTQIIVREGDTVTPEIISQIHAVKTYSQSNRQANRFLGLLAIIAALLWVSWKFIQHNLMGTRFTLSAERTFALFGFVVVSQTLLMSALFRLAEFTAMQNTKAPFKDPGLWAFAIPFAFGSLLITLLSDRRTALFTGLILSLIAGLIAPKPLEFVLYSAIASAVAVYGIGRYRTRQSVTIAGALVGAASAIAAVALVSYSQQPFVLNTILLVIACGLLNGLVTAGVTAVFLPACETLFGILTDVKLLELSNADLPVLGQLALRAPGTNQHSHAVGQLAEEACRAVDANGLLARIGALYHDMGKVAAPEHFVENQLGKNPHDRLKPAQSAKIIISHVTYGVKMAKELGLPQRIIDFIPQHHGTRTLHYFLRKAETEADQTGTGPVDENEFRYPGPKPQFKEAAIMMISDSCEAAARSLEDPTPENIRFIVTKIIDAILSDDQLNECDLTLRELTLIRESIIRSLSAIYHSRIDYPGYTPPQAEPKFDPAELDSEERGHRYQNPADIPISKGGEIEDEAV